MARRILRVASARRTRLRYPVGPAAYWLPLLKVIVPQRLFSLLVRRGYRLPARADWRPH